MTLVFLALGGVGLLLLAVSLFADHALDLGADIHGEAPGFLSTVPIPEDERGPTLGVEAYFAQKEADGTVGFVRVA